MPWLKVEPMDERFRFITEVQTGQHALAELCRQFGISRKTGHKWLARFESQGLEGLRDASRAPRFCPHKTEAAIEEKIIALRMRWPTWGPRKLAAKLLREGIAPPAASTIGDIIMRAGLVSPRNTRQRGMVSSWSQALTKPQRPNDVWAVDFKGWFRTRDGRPCHPLTVSDLYSRYLLGCPALADQRRTSAEREFDVIFERYGLPEKIRVDNGSPFGSTGPCGLTRLSVHWLRHGIGVEFIRPGHPQDNGSHERMHKTLKAEASRPPEANLAKQALRLERWRHEFNTERPHEALGQRPPAEVYHPSTRTVAGNFRDFEYPRWYEKRRVREDGTIHWQGVYRFVGQAFAGSNVGLIEGASGDHDVFLGDLLLGILSGKGQCGLIPRGSTRTGPPDLGREKCNPCTRSEV